MFSWSDSVHAALSCLPCLNSSDSPSQDHHQSPPSHPHAFAHAIPPPRARPDELESLLANAHDDADALSLHTNPGDRRRPKHSKRRTPPKHIRILGFDLFGRSPAIQLPDSDDERVGSTTHRVPRPRTNSGSTLDSDAAPLDTSAIEELSAARSAAALVREEQQRREKEERRRRRREHRELKKAAMARALELQAHGGDEFEGFQGSGPAIPPFSPSLGSGTGSGSMSVTSSQEFGPFAHGQLVEHFDADAALAAEEADGVDFGGESYASRPPPAGTKSSSGTRTSTSDTRSSSTGTGSNGQAHRHSQSRSLATPAPYNHQFQAYVRSPLSPTSDTPSVPPSSMSPTSDAASTTGIFAPEEKRKRRKSKSMSKLLSASASNSTTGSSLTSPPPSEDASVSAVAVAGGEGFEGFVGHLGMPERGAAMVDMNLDPAAKEGRKGYTPVAGFSSVGLGIQRRKSEMGVFLARRGDE